jgi:transcriptional regulator with XRE-family HTH domain
MNHERLASELLRALRGKRSQTAFGRRLGYRANVAYSWESGRRFPFASTLFRGASLNKISFDGFAAFARTSELRSARIWDAGDTSRFLRGVSGNARLASMARCADVDRTTIARWLRGSAEPRVPQILAFVDRMTHRLVEFVGLFVEPESLPTLRELARELAAQRRVAYDLPWSHAVLRALELESYRAATIHDPRIIANAISTSVEDVESHLGALSRAGLVRRQRKKWQPNRVLTVDTRADPEGDLLLKEHWAEVGLDRLRRRANRSEAFHSYNLFAVSNADFARLRELHLEYYERVRSVVAESHVAERVVLLNQQLIPLDAAPGVGLQLDRARRRSL